MTVRESLEASIAAHNSYRDALTRNAKAEARLHLQEASDRRAEAQNANSGFSDDAWAEYEGRYPHTALTLYYRQELAK